MTNANRACYSIPVPVARALAQAAGERGTSLGAVLREALAAYLRGAVRPRASYERVSLRLDPEVRRQIAELAGDVGLSASAVVADALTQALLAADSSGTSAVYALNSTGGED